MDARRSINLYGARLEPILKAVCVSLLWTTLAFICAGSIVSQEIVWVSFGELMRVFDDLVCHIVRNKIYILLLITILGDLLCSLIISKRPIYGIRLFVFIVAAVLSILIFIGSGFDYNEEQVPGFMALVYFALNMLKFVDYYETKIKIKTYNMETI